MHLSFTRSIAKFPGRQTRTEKRVSGRLLWLLAIAWMNIGAACETTCIVEREREKKQGKVTLWIGEYNDLLGITDARVFYPRSTR
jgi:hypothetical protein